MKVVLEVSLRRRSPALFFALALAAAAPLAATSSHPAHADETAKARATFQEGVQLEAAGNYASALSKFQTVASVKRTPTVLFHVAFCQEKLGHLVEALGGYRIAVHEAGDDAKMAKVAQTAGDAQSALEKRIPTLSLKRGANADLAKISIDGQEMGGASLDKPMQLDPGSHQIEATSAGREPFSSVVKLAEGDTKTVEITFKEKSKGAAVPADSSDADPKDKPKDDKNPPPASSGDSGGSVVPWVIGGVGVASMIVGGVFYLQRNSAKSDIDNQCRSGPICPTSAQSTQDKGKSDALLGNVFMAIGVVGVGVGAVWLLTQGPSSPDPAPAAASVKKPSWDVAVSPVRGGMGASFVGSFLSSSEPHRAEGADFGAARSHVLRVQLP